MVGDGGCYITSYSKIRCRLFVVDIKCDMSRDQEPSRISIQQSRTGMWERLVKVMFQNDSVHNLEL